MSDVPRPDSGSMRHSRHPAHRPRAARAILPRDAVGRQLAAEHGLVIESVRWDSKPLPTLGDALAPIRRRPWAAQGFAASPADQAAQNVPADLIGRHGRALPVRAHHSAGKPKLGKSHGPQLRPWPRGLGRRLTVDCRPARLAHASPLAARLGARPLQPRPRAAETGACGGAAGRGLAQRGARHQR